MARVKGAMMARKRRNKTLKLAKGYWGAKSKHRMDHYGSVIQLFLLMARLLPSLIRETSLLCHPMEAKHAS